MNLDDTLLEQLITTVFSFGNYAGNIRFVGMEEDGENSLERLVKRLEARRKLAKQELVDSNNFQMMINYHESFIDPV